MKRPPRKKLELLELAYRKARDARHAARAANDSAAFAIADAACREALSALEDCRAHYGLPRDPSSRFGSTLP